MASNERKERMKSKQEIESAEHECFQRRWYDRSIMLAQSGKDIGAAKDARARIEEKHTDLEPMSDFDWGYLAGKHAALRWVLWDDVDWDEPGLGDT
jgi:hypothetical protein